VLAHQFNRKGTKVYLRFTPCSAPIANGHKGFVLYAYPSAHYDASANFQIGTFSNFQIQSAHPHIQKQLSYTPSMQILFSTFNCSNFGV